MATVNFVKENICFIEYASDNAVTANERLLWYALLHVFNTRSQGQCWPDGFIPISNRRLLSFLPYGEDSFFRARNSLAQRGIIQYKAGKRNAQTPLYSMSYFSTNRSFNPKFAGNIDGNIPGNVEGNMPGNVPGNSADIGINLNVNQNQTNTQANYDGAWRTSARARGAVAQRLLDSWPGKRDGYSDAHFDLCEYLAKGMSPEQIGTALEGCNLASLIPNHLFTEALHLGLVDEKEAPEGY